LFDAHVAINVHSGIILKVPVWHAEQDAHGQHEALL